MPASGLNVVDFIMQLLTANRDILNQMFCGGNSSKQLDMHASSHRLPILPRGGASASARISELEARVRDARAVLLADPCSGGLLSTPHAALQSDVESRSTLHHDTALHATLVEGDGSPARAALPVNYAESIALNAKRRDKAHMQAVFERHRDIKEKGLSKAALMAALQEVGAPVLSSSDGASEDSLFHRADTNMSNFVDLNEWVVSRLIMCCACGNDIMRRFMLVANLPDDLEMFLDDHSLGVSAAAALQCCAQTCHSRCSAVRCTVAQSARTQRNRPASWPSVADYGSAGCCGGLKCRFIEGRAAQGAAAAARDQPGARNTGGAAEQHQVPNPQDGCRVDRRFPQRTVRSHR